MPDGTPSPQNDWFEPPPETLPKSSPWGALPSGSVYSPSRNQWRTPTGHMFDAGGYKPHWHPAGAGTKAGILQPTSGGKYLTHVYDPTDVVNSQTT